MRFPMIRFRSIIYLNCIISYFYSQSVRIKCGINVCSLYLSLRLRTCCKVYFSIRYYQIVSYKSLPFLFIVLCMYTFSVHTSLINNVIKVYFTLTEFEAFMWTYLLSNNMIRPCTVSHNPQGASYKRNKT